MAILEPVTIAATLLPLLLGLYSLTNRTRRHILCNINFHSFPPIILFSQVLIYLCLSKMDGVGVRCASLRMHLRLLGHTKTAIEADNPGPIYSESPVLPSRMCSCTCCNSRSLFFHICHFNDELCFLYVLH
jgi:hypothetical protein